jgi:hypothetical protein
MGMQWRSREEDSGDLAVGYIVRGGGATAVDTVDQIKEFKSSRYKREP